MLLPTPVVTVSQLNRFIKNHLEQEIGFIQVEGELSNLSRPASGHLYFTLKDQHAQVRCVFFKNRHSGPTHKTIKEGQQFIAGGKLSLYEARGDYQLIVEELKETGFGALYLQFEALKEQLAAEGLFALERKKALPKIPQTIGIITSPSGAALQDILSTLAHRFSFAKLVIYPCEVQGSTASSQLINALIQANTEARCEVLILARGGGSIEDLWAFNNEALARQIAASAIPIISGIGHETDFTIADFAADYRAATPTAAATIATPHKDELLEVLMHLVSRMHTALTRQMQNYHLKLDYLNSALSSPAHIISTYWQKVAFLQKQLQLVFTHLLNQKQHLLTTHNNRLHQNNPVHLVQRATMRVDQLKESLNKLTQLKISALRNQLHNSLSTLHAVSPLATLERGYSITTHNNHVIYNTNNLQIGDTVHVRLAHGLLDCEIKNFSELTND